uniref:Uncharacterized protein n=1 Tax=Ditylenchus dipsaci TaxID=166011 RepID=A0A915D5S0_9BILA
MAFTEEDDVVAELEVVVASDCNVGRLLFHTREPHLKHAEFKQKVKQLQLGMAKKEDDYSEYMETNDAEDDATTYQGEGMPRLEMVNNAIGFLRNGKLILVPVSDVYDMQPKIHNKAADEAVGQKKIDETKLSEVKKEGKVQVLRSKFARVETDYQKKRRENSSQFKQKEIDEDKWIPLTVVEKDPAELYRQYYMDDSVPHIKSEY